MLDEAERGATEKVKPKSNIHKKNIEISYNASKLLYITMQQNIKRESDVDRRKREMYLSTGL